MIENRMWAFRLSLGFSGEPVNECPIYLNRQEIKLEIKDYKQEVSPGYNGEFWETFKHDGCIAIGNWGLNGLDDLAKYCSKDELKDAGVSASGAIQLWSFFRDMKVGDIIIAYSEKCIWGIGKVISKYYFKNDSRYWQNENYIRDVEWKEIHPPLNVGSDERLFGDPPMRYGILNKQLTVFEINGIDWGYMVNNYPVLKI